MDLMLFRVTVIAEMNPFFIQPPLAESNITTSEVQTNGRSDFVKLKKHDDSVSGKINLYYSDKTHSDADWKPTVEMLS